MKFRFFFISALESESGQEELNQFCSGHAIAGIEKHFVDAGTRSFWSVVVEYVENSNHTAVKRKAKIDYKEVLSEQDFAQYSRLRNLRKMLADKEGVPVYALFTNEQLAEMVRQQPSTAASLLQIDGVGKARVDKYGDSFLSMLHDSQKEETTGETDAH